MAPPLLLVVLCLMLATPVLAGGEIYKWVDAEGRVHFTQDLGQVPAQHRHAAELSRHRVTTRKVQRFESPVQGQAYLSSASQLSVGRRYEIPFEMRGSAMFVYVKINDRVTAPFIVDTGATDVAVPAHVARQAGIEITSQTPRATYQTANGRVEKPIVKIGAVQVGDVRVEGVRGSISDRMQIGLLGGSFFNNFTFQVDPAAQIITLIANPHIRAGIPEAKWRERFAEARGRLQALTEYIEANRFADEARLVELKTRQTEFAEAIEALEREADQAGVPQAWRVD